MRQLTVHLFGRLEIRSSGDLLPAFRTQRSTSLFSYLVASRDRLIHRDVLCGRLWGDLPDRAARKALRTALWRIRSVLEPRAVDRGSYLEADGNHVGFRGSGEVWVDVWEFEDCVGRLGATGEEALDPVEAEGLARASSLYRGDFLDGHYDEWCVAERERLRLNFLTILERLVAHRRRNHQWLEAIRLGRDLLRHDPLREHIHRALMECHLAMGDRPSALRQYAACVRSLRDELDIEPMEETERLRERICDAEPLGEGAGNPVHGALRGPELGQLAEEVDGALRTLRTLTQQLERTRVSLAERRVLHRRPPGGRIHSHPNRSRDAAS
jgi:DNA-binding SARP family transcriptional activator